MNTNGYLQSILKSQDLPDESDELKALQAHRKDVEDLLHKHFAESSPTIRYGGSRAKGTLIREFYDLDVICYFPYDDTAAGVTLEDIYNNVEQALSTAYYIERKTSALRLKSRDPKSFAKDFHIDVVPGRFTDDKKTDAFIYQNAGEKKRLKTNPCLAKTMGRFRFRKPAQRVIERDFHGIVSAKSVGTSGYHTKFVVEALDGTVGYLSFGTKPVQQQLLMGA